MALTRVTAFERDDRRVRLAARRLSPGDLLLVVTSLVAALAIALAYAGRMRTLAWAAQHGGSSAAVVDLNTVTGTNPLEAVLRQRFENPADAGFAARKLITFLGASATERRELANVGGILRIQVPVEEVDRDARLVAYAERLSDARARAFTARQNLPATIPLLTTADLLELKPRLAVRGPSSFRWTVFVWSLLFVAGFHLVSLIWRVRKMEGDRVLLSAVHLLTALGFALLLSRSDPLRDTLLFVRFTQGTLVGLTLLTLASTIDFRKRVFGEFSYVPLALAGALCVVLILFGGGPGGSGAKVNLGPVQPIEAIRLLLSLFLAGYFASRWELLRDVRSRQFRGVALPAALNLPRVEYVLPVLIGVGVALGFFFIQKDLGPALFLSFIFLSMYAVARRAVVLSIVGLALLVAGFYTGYRLEVSDTLADRVRIWQSPWDNAARGGDQIAQAHWALATGAVPGTGLGIGDSRYVPAGHTDLALATIGEELGLAGLLIVATLFALIVRRGLRIARGAPTDYAFFLALAVTLTLIVPVLVMAGGMLGLIPLTGVVTPFVSYGGSAMAANLAGVGILIAIRNSRRDFAVAQSTPVAASDPFRVPLRALAGVLGACALILIGALVNVQAIQRDDFLVRPQLSLQADGGRRFVYNARVLDVVRQIPRGSILDRNRLPLATGDPSLVAKSKDDYDDIGITLARACADRDERCYPLGGVAFHLLGDARTRLNWSASNTSYVERDREDRLRGFSDHATTVRTTDASGQTAYAVRRDYRDVIGLVRHRYEPRHPAAMAVLAQPRDLRLSLDARLQIRVGSILSRYASASKAGNAAAVVLDATTGDILAAVSYPWPDLEALEEDRRDSADLEDELLDRARFGLYPPGSTFKMITAAAALSHRDSGQLRFACRRLPDGRVGATVPGLGRPIRDDVLDTRPHGAIDLHQALVVSCNAYFAQLAVRIGQAQLAGTSARAGISIAPRDIIGRDALAHAGYGQGPVLTTPMKLARVAAAVGTDGVIRGPSLDRTADEESGDPHLLSEPSARLLARALRDAVLAGTGRQLRAHPGRIAGKTGTAQVAGAPSHAWFAGFAPYGPAARRIAFAVILENAGYGGANAAAAAGEIVSAASSLDLLKFQDR